MNTDLYYYTIISLLQSRYQKQARLLLSSYRADEIYKKLNPGRYDSISDHVSAVYGNDIERASEKILIRSEDIGIHIEHFDSVSYPSSLRHISDPPFVLYMTRNLPENKMIALVGSRKGTKISKDVTFKLSSKLSSSGYSIVSGMAYGIDRSAHLGALAVSGATVGVLANGINIQYPSGNKDVFEKINNSKDSVLISEYAPDIKAGKWTFLKRNRIISGLSKAVIVTQAAKKSGALITAKYAMEQNRDLLVCPGHSYDPLFEGCINLLQQGAYPLYSVEDVANYLNDNLYFVKEDCLFETEVQHSLFDDEQNNLLGNALEFLKKKYFDEDIESRILNSIELGTFGIDEISRNTGIDISIINRKLIQMEIAGEIAINGRNISVSVN